MKTIIKPVEKISAILLFVSILVPLPAIVNAQLVDVRINGEATGEVSVDDNLELELNTGVEIDSQADSQIETRTDASENYLRSENETSGGNEAIIKLRTNSVGIAVTSHTQVNTDEDLEVFSSNISARNESVSRVNIGSGDEFNVRVNYKHRAKLLGLLPVSIKSKTDVNFRANADAEVRSRLSWWGFLVTSENYSRAELESRIKNSMNVRANATAEAEVATTAEISNSARAQVAEAIVAEIEAHAKSKMNTKASADASASVDADSNARADSQ